MRREHNTTQLHQTTTYSQEKFRDLFRPLHRSHRHQPTTSPTSLTCFEALYSTAEHRNNRRLPKQNGTSYKPRTLLNMSQRGAQNVLIKSSARDYVQFTGYENFSTTLTQQRYNGAPINKQTPEPSTGMWGCIQSLEQPPDPTPPPPKKRYTPLPP